MENKQLNIEEQYVLKLYNLLSENGKGRLELFLEQLVLKELTKEQINSLTPAS